MCIFVKQKQTEKMATKKTTQKKIVDLFSTLSQSQQIALLEDLEEIRLSSLTDEEYFDDYMEKLVKEEEEKNNKKFDELFGDIE